MAETNRMGVASGNISNTGLELDCSSANDVVDAPASTQHGESVEIGSAEVIRSVTAFRDSIVEEDTSMSTKDTDTDTTRHSIVHADNVRGVRTSSVGSSATNRVAGLATSRRPTAADKRRYYAAQARKDASINSVNSMTSAATTSSNTVEGGRIAIYWSHELPFRSIFAITPMSTASVTAYDVSTTDRRIFQVIHQAPLWVAMILVQVSQAGIIYYLSKVVDDVDNECQDTPRMLQLIALLVFTTQIWRDIWETFKYGIYLRVTPTVKQWTNANVFVVDDRTGEPDKFAPGHGITNHYRYALYLIVILPKFLIAVALWWFGTGFLVNSTTDADLLLNTVALLFVLDLDENLGDLVPEYVRDNCAKFPVLYETEETIVHFPPITRAVLLIYTGGGAYVILSVVLIAAFAGHAGYCGNAN
eukprot:m.8951 g.8951  ORF g.8951 m.8951 type:complete len:418 (-) comp6783_c0_seq2:89-1342(-)